MVRGVLGKYSPIRRLYQAPRCMSISALFFLLKARFAWVELDSASTGTKGQGIRSPLEKWGKLSPKNQWEEPEKVRLGVGGEMVRSRINWVQARWP